MISLPTTNPTNQKRIPLQLHQFPSRNIRPLRHLQHILIDISAEIGWIVAIHGDADVLAQERENFGDFGGAGDGGVGDWTTGEAEIAGFQHLYKARVFDDVRPVVDAVDLEFVYCLGEVGEGVGLVDVAMEGEEVAFFGGALEDLGLSAGGNVGGSERRDSR